LEAPGANALPQAAEGLGASLAPNEVAGVGRLGIGGNQPPVLWPAQVPIDRSRPLLSQPNPFSPTLDDMHPAEQALTANKMLDPAYMGPVKPRARDVELIAKDLHDNSQQALKDLGVPSGRIEGPHADTEAIMARAKANPAQPLGPLGPTDELVARNLASETKAAIDRGGITAFDWYSKKFEDAMRVAATIHPEIATDEHAAALYKAALAITSQGETVPSNTRLADIVYSHYKATYDPAKGHGQFPTSIVAKQGPAMNTGLAKMNGLLEAIGPERTAMLLSDVRSAREWKQLGFEISGENADTMVHGSAILGPKIGGGFYQNLSGNFNPTTFDLWWMRKWSRTTGTLVGLQDLTKQRARLEALHAAARGDTTLPPEIQKLAAKPVPLTRPALLRRAEDIEAAHERDYTRNRALYDSGERDKSELAKAAIAYRAGVNGINETPSGGGHREWMRTVVRRAREILAEHGIHMTNADLQATLWYPEKDLYAKLGGKPSEGLNMDYSTAHQNLAKQKGVSDARIQSALAGGDAGGVGADVAARDQAGGAGRGQGRPLQPAGNDLGGVAADPQAVAGGAAVDGGPIVAESRARQNQGPARPLTAKAREKEAKKLQDIIDMRAKASAFGEKWHALSVEEQRQIADEVLQAKEEPR
jgi:hypothetical protein